PGRGGPAAFRCYFPASVRERSGLGGKPDHPENRASRAATAATKPERPRAGSHRPGLSQGQPTADANPAGTPTGGYQGMTNTSQDNIPAAVALKYYGERAPSIYATDTWK